MRREVVKSAEATRDLVEQATYFEEQAPSIAQRFLDAVEQSFNLLAGMPEIGGVYETQDSRLAGIRLWRVKDFEKHVIFYRDCDAHIEVIRVLHGARDIAAVLGDD